MSAGEGEIDSDQIIREPIVTYEKNECDALQWIEHLEKTLNSSTDQGEKKKIEKEMRAWKRLLTRIRNMKSVYARALSETA